MVDAHDRVIGTATRRQVHANRNLLHRASGVFVFNRKQQLLMQKRSQTKDMYPGYWVFSVGGHVDSGDTYELAASRELKEELGIEAPLVPMEKMLQEDAQEREWWMTYALIHDGPFPHFNRTEADEVRFFNVKDLINRAERDTLPIPPTVKKTLYTVQRWIEEGKIQQLIHTNIQ